MAWHLEISLRDSNLNLHFSGWLHPSHWGETVILSFWKWGISNENDKNKYSSFRRSLTIQKKTLYIYIFTWLLPTLGKKQSFNCWTVSFRFYNLFADSDLHLRFFLSILPVEVDLFTAGLWDAMIPWDSVNRTNSQVKPWETWLWRKIRVKIGDSNLTWTISQVGKSSI